MKLLDPLKHSLNRVFSLRRPQIDEITKSPSCPEHDTITSVLRYTNEILTPFHARHESQNEHVNDAVLLCYSSED